MPGQQKLLTCPVHTRSRIRQVGRCCAPVRHGAPWLTSSLQSCALRTNKIEMRFSDRQFIFSFRRLAHFRRRRSQIARRNGEIPFACVILNSVKVNFDNSLFLMDFAFFRRRHNRCADYAYRRRRCHALIIRFVFVFFPVSFFFTWLYEKFISLTVAHQRDRGRGQRPATITNEQSAHTLRAITANVFSALSAVDSVRPTVEPYFFAEI